MNKPSIPAVGAQYRLENEIYVVTSIHDDRVSLCSWANGRHRYLSHTDFAALEYRNLIVKHCCSLSELSDATRLIRSERDRTQYDRRRAYVEEYLRLRDTGTNFGKRQTKSLIGKLSDSLGDRNPPSTSTLYAWTNRYLISNRNPLSLLPHYPQQRQLRIQNTTNELIKHYINSVYLSKERPSITYTFRLLKGHINAENSKRAKADLPLLKYPSYSTFWRRITSIDSYLASRARYGSKATQKLFKYGRALYVDDDLYGCTQYDAQRMDIFLIDEQGEVVGRPILLAGLNLATRECTGWNISMGSACAEKLASAIQMSILGEPDDQTTGGKMRIIDVDNGAECVNAWIQNIVNLLGISLRYAPPGQPDAKAFIERFFRTVNTGLIHMLPGTTRSSPQDLGDYKSEKYACFTLPELRNAFSKWLDIYHNTYHEQLFTSPREKRLELLKKCPPPERYAPEDLKQLSLGIKNCCINKGRVKLFALAWSGPGLPDLARRLRPKEKALVYFDPCDLSLVWVARKDTPRELQPAYAVYPNYQAELTLSEHQSIRRAILDKRSRFDESSALKMRLELQKEIEDIKKKTRKRTKAKLSAHHRSDDPKTSELLGTDLSKHIDFETFNLQDIQHES